MKRFLNIKDVISKFFKTNLEKSISLNEVHKFSAAQLEQIQLGKENGLSVRQVKYYSKPEIHAMDMWDIREKLIFIVDVPFLVEKYSPARVDIIHPKYIGWAATIGGICGDIAGSRYEFFNCDRKGISFETVFTMHSRITDDSVLMLATLDAVESSETDRELKRLLIVHEDNFSDEAFPFGETAYSRMYRKYYKEYPSVGYGGGFADWALAGKGPYRSFGNGSAMRVAPIGEGLEKVEDVILHAVASAACTHNHPEGIKGAVVIAVCVWMARHWYSKEEILGYVKEHYRNQDMIRKYTMKEVRSCNQGGYAVACQFTVPAAITCFMESDSFEECIENVLSFDGDSDTIAAIAGAVAGAYYGELSDKVKDIVLEKLPEELRKIIGKCEEYDSCEECKEEHEECKGCTRWTCLECPYADI